MLNGVNKNEELNNSQLSEQSGVSGITNPISRQYKNIDKNLLIDETSISNEAVVLYEKELDVNKFNTLAMSDPEDLSHEEIISNLFNKGVSDPLSEEAVENLAANEGLLKDLSL